MGSAGRLPVRKKPVVFLSKRRMGGAGMGMRKRHLLGLLPNLHHVEHGGKAVPGASVRRPSWDPAVETSAVAGYPLGSRPLRRTVRNRMSLIHTFADNHTQNHIHYGFALGVGAGRNVAPGKRVELPSGRNCFPGLFEREWGQVGQQGPDD